MIRILMTIMSKIILGLRIYALYACKNGGDDDDDDDEDSQDDDDLPTSNQKRSCEVTLAHPTTCMFKTCSRYLVLRQ